MKAITRTQYGGPEVLQLKDVLAPKPNSNQILVRVHATTVSRTDCGILWGEPKIIRAFTGFGTPKLPITGCDFAGVVEEIGTAVTQFKVADRVWGFNDQCLQSHAEYLVIEENDAVAKIPDGISFLKAAASAEGAHYALNYVLNMKMQKHHRILINGGTGGIGSAGIQILKALGAHVTATAPSAHVQTVKLLGADVVIDYQAEDFTQCGEKFDFVFDAVGKSEWKKCKPLLLPGGAYISSELGPGAENLYLPILTAFSNLRMRFPIPVQRKRSVRYIANLLAEGKFNPLIDKTLMPDQIGDAFTYVRSGQKIGNVIIQFQD